MAFDDEILSYQSNRAYPLPDKPWKYYQEWHDTIFLHWRANPKALKAMLPETLELDLYDGVAWVSLVAFSVKGMRPRSLPSISFLSDFHEINIRTYVKRNGIPGIYFLTIEAGKLLPAILARLLIGVPYVTSKIKREEHQYYGSSKNGYLELDYSVGGLIAQKSPLEIWLSERHALFENKNDKIFRVDIHHWPWQLHQVKLRTQLTVYSALNECVIKMKPDLIHFAPPLKILMWGREWM
ncbi:DUF2071 domain-containing protein [Flavobacterium sp. J372]|uniref:YqjF family protein n=1 Tax=Flavobacterium sp. J372 TaxID=2898436 RepID=UPI0021517453|nr:DUF2071 domain-containing protein [Flavobacterium sp. J372]MCR5862050.1 DUF2071 domain-containing protein [Flavobacterium sp. J372]